MNQQHLIIWSTGKEEGMKEMSSFYFLISSNQHKVSSVKGRGGGLVVSALAHCSEDPSSNPAVFKILVRKNKRKSGRGWPI